MLAGLFIKSSIVCFYRRIFRGTIFNIVTIALLVVIVCWGISIFLATLLQCAPIRMVWQSLSGSPERNAQCINVIPLFYAMAISNLILDILILAIPIPMVWKLQMPRSRKVAVSGIFLLGALLVSSSKPTSLLHKILMRFKCHRRCSRQGLFLPDYWEGSWEDI